MKNQQGQVLIYAIIISTLVASGGYYLIYSMAPLEDVILNNYKYSAQMIKENIMSVLDNEAAWQRTVNLNTKLQCLQTSGALCSSLSFGIINVYDADGTVVQNNTASSGFDLSGKPCSTFSKTNPSASCVFQYKISWSCNGTCEPTKFLGSIPVASLPRVKLTATFDFSPPSTKKRSKSLLNINNTAYTFDFVRGSKNKTLSQFCNSIDGIFDQKDSVCNSAISKPTSYFDCATPSDPHRWFIGFKSDGTPICKSDVKLGKMCGPGTAVISYAEDGSLICGIF